MEKYRSLKPKIAGRLKIATMKKNVLIKSIIIRVSGIKARRTILSLD